MVPVEFVSIDVETTSLDPERGNIIEFGAVYTRLNSENGSLLEEHSYQKRVLPSSGTWIWNPDTLDFHLKLKTLDRLQHLESIKDNYLFENFEYWLKSISFEGVGCRFTVAGKNFSGFDNLFLEKLPGFKGGDGKGLFRKRVLDLGNLLWEPKKDGMILPDLPTCLARKGILHLFTGGTGQKLKLHSALDDAIAVAMCVRRIYEDALLHE